MAQVLVTENYLSGIASAIRLKNGQSVTYAPSQMESAIREIYSAGDLSIISKTILANGSYSPSDDGADAFSDVVVNVSNSFSSGDEGKVVQSGSLVSQTSFLASINSVFDTTLNDQVVVSVPTGGGVYISKNITENGTYNPADDNVDAYSQVIVNVSGGGGVPSEIITGGSFSFFDSSISYLRSNAFYANSGLLYVEMTNVKIIDASCFLGCSQLQRASFPECLRMEYYAFNGCSNLSEIYLPNVSYINNGAFSKCSLASVSFSKCEHIGTNVFCSCSSLSVAQFSILSWIESTAFSGCRQLMSLILLSSSVCLLTNSNAFSTTPMRSSSYTGSFGSIYVPSSLVSEYKSASYWSYYSERITSYMEG